jgi:hypothetical protein
MLREFKERVELVALEGLEVEDEALQVHNQHVWGRGYQSSLAHVDLLLAATALVVADDLTLDQLLETIVHALDVLHSQREVVEAFQPVLCMPTLLAHEL